jgi:hypothetical protein
VSSIPGRKQRLAALVLKMSVSLDGFVAPVDGSTGWIAAGGSDDALSWTVETVSNACAHPAMTIVRAVASLPPADAS